MDDSAYRTIKGLRASVVASWLERSSTMTLAPPRRGRLRPWSLRRALRTLSGGTRQKLNAAIAFLFRPALLILDEPTAGLDPVASGRLKDKIRALRAQGTTVLLSSHLIGEIEELADDLVFLVEGRIRYAGRLAELKAQTGERSVERAMAALLSGGRA
jgi:Cu-processing system ATP-binding protein